MPGGPRRLVWPVPRELRGQLLPHCRLYAYPVEPEPPPADGFVLLDSGAYGLSRSGGRMTPRYLEQLAEHYRRHAGPAVHCVAPDVYLDPAATLRQYSRFRYSPVVPVVQMDRAGQLSPLLTAIQARRYPRSRFVAFSNPGLRSRGAHRAAWEACFNAIRAAHPGCHLHVLGAGWDEQDLRDWLHVDGWDSMDSIAYYTTAREQSGPGWPEAAVRLAQDWSAITGNGAA
jgi:hypothetical protein